MDQWEEFSDDPTLNTGHFMALNFDAIPDDDYVLTVAFEGGTIEETWILNSTMTSEQRSKILFLDDPAEQTLTFILTSSILPKPIVKVFTFDVIALPEPPAFTLTTIAASQASTVLNQLVSSLQADDITVGQATPGSTTEFELAGSLLYKQGFSDYSVEPTEQEGHYVALHISSMVPADSAIKIEVNEGGTISEITNKDASDNFVVRITESTVAIIVTLTKDAEHQAFTYDPAALTLPPAFTLTTIAASQASTVLNQLVSSLQADDITVGQATPGSTTEFELAGSLLYKQGFSDYSVEPTEQEGHYVALHISSMVPADSAIKIEVNEGGTISEITNKDASDNFVVRITESTVAIIVTLTKDAEHQAFTYDPAALTLTPQ